MPPRTRLSETELNRFYKTDIGKEVAASLTHKLEESDFGNDPATGLALGYSTPFHEALEGRAHIHALPGELLAETSGEGDYIRAAIVNGELLPFTDQCFSWLLCVHGMGGEESQKRFKEFFRVLKGEGKLMLVVPHRNSLWPKNATCPFATEPRFGGRDLRRCLEDEGFEVDRLESALSFWPSERRWLRRFSGKLGNISARLLPTSGALLVVQARKRMFRPVKGSGLREMVSKLIPGREIQARES